MPPPDSMTTKPNKPIMARSEQPAVAPGPCEFSLVSNPHWHVSLTWIAFTTSAQHSSAQEPDPSTAERAELVAQHVEEVAERVEDAIEKAEVITERIENVLDCTQTIMSTVEDIATRMESAATRAEAATKRIATALKSSGKVAITAGSCTFCILASLSTASD